MAGSVKLTREEWDDLRRRVRVAGSSALTLAEWERLRLALSDPAAEGDQIAGLLSEVDWVPYPFLELLLQAALIMPQSANLGWYLRPCVRSFGGRVVLEALLHYLLHGTLTEQRVAAHGLWWVQMFLHPGDPSDPASRAAVATLEGLADLWRRKREARVKVFLETDDLELQREVFPEDAWQHLDEHPHEVRLQMLEVLSRGLVHADEIIRDDAHRALRDPSQDRLPPGFQIRL